jgi:ketosteroid isomerase-like protein
MNRRLLLSLAAATATAACGTMRPRDAEASAQPERLRAAETAFAATMAARDLGAFATFIADDAVFINGGKPLRGKAAIVEHWRRFYSGPRAPFSWKPEIVEVLGSGQLGYSEGPVADPDGVVVARYASTWRLDPAGQWKVVFDNGTEVCRCAKAP